MEACGGAPHCLPKIIGVGRETRGGRHVAREGAREHGAAGLQGLDQVLQRVRAHEGACARGGVRTRGRAHLQRVRALGVLVALGVQPRRLHARPAQVQLVLPDDVHLHVARVRRQPRVAGLWSEGLQEGITLLPF